MKTAAATAILLLAIGQPAFTQSLFPRAAPSGAEAALVQRGQAAYGRECLNCHGATLDGTQFGVALKGPAFVAKWQGSSRADFSQRIRTTMPPGKIGTLDAATLADIEGYVLFANAGVAGAAASRDSASAREGAAMMGAAERRDNDPQYREAIAARTARLSSLAPVSEALLANPPAGDWLMWRRTWEGLGHSPLKQIHRGNVRSLRTAWSWVLPASGNQITPLVYAGVMFVASGNAVHALDAATGELLWQYSSGTANAGGPGAAHGRSLAVLDNRLFAAMPDGRMVALDIRTGKPLWTHAVVGGSPATAFSLSSGPLAAKGVVMIGVSLGVANAGGCYILGLDAATGEERWRFHTIARPGEPGGDTWNGAPLEERYGGGVWTVGSYDAQLNLAYFGTGNTYSTATLLEKRPGAAAVTNNDALYTDSTLALRPETGELVWHFQHHRRDVWDLDWVFEHSLLTVNVAGKPRRLVVTGGKVAVFEAMDAATGQFVSAADLGLQNIFTAIDPRTGEKAINPAVLPEAGVAKLMCPNSIGARNWTASATDPGTAVLYVPLLENCADYTYAPRDAAQTAKGGIDIRFAARAPLNHDGQFGRLAALDLKTGKVLWTHRQRVPFASATLSTAGGLVFAGDVDRQFAAYDARNGQRLWQTRLAASAESYPISYSANGRQYIAVVAGGGSPWGSASRAFTPEVAAAPAGTSVVVFELPR